MRFFILGQKGKKCNPSKGKIPDGFWEMLFFGYNLIRIGVSQLYIIAQNKKQNQILKIKGAKQIYKTQRPEKKLKCTYIDCYRNTAIVKQYI